MVATLDVRSAARAAAGPGCTVEIESVVPHDGVLRVVRSASTSSSPMLPPQLPDAILEQIERECDVELTGYHRSTVHRQLQARMKRRQVAVLQEYLQLLADSAEERVALQEAILIGSTRFFRDDDVFARLAAVMDWLCASSVDAPIRIWVPGCSTGEEVYSLLILLHERMAARGQSRPVRVYASDLRRSALAHGREGVYGARSCEALSPERLARFFVRVEGRYRLVRELRSSVLWARHDVARDPPYPHMDLISCRNLLVHYDRPTQDRILRKLHFSLRPGGLLWLGSAESTLPTESLFRPLSLACRLYTKSAAFRPSGSQSAHPQGGPR